MKGFFQLTSSRDFLGLFDRFEPVGTERLLLSDSRDRILAADVVAPEALPPFSRSTMDGFAVRAKDTFGCSESEPALLTLAGEIAMGACGRDLTLQPGQATAIWTGGELPVHGDAVVMVEYTNQLDAQTVEIYRPVAPGENIIRAGEDFEAGATVLRRGHRLRPQDIGVLAGLGITEVEVYKYPVVAIISTGDELVEPEREPGPGKIRDINSSTLAALVDECGGVPVPLGIISDNREAMAAACAMALDLPADIVLLSGGSSVGRKDFTLKVFEQLDGAEVLAHGVSIRPGKPTIFAHRGNTALFGLPGHVGSAIVVFQLFVRPLLRRLAGERHNTSLRRIQAVTAEQIPSTIGREEFVRVILTDTDGSGPPEATPVYGKSGLLNPLVRADGLLVIDRDTEGLDAGETAPVILFP